MQYSTEEKAKMLARCRKMAQEKGGKCLSKIYVRSGSLMSWQCGDCGYVWKATANSIEQGSWCRPCSYEHRSNAQKRDFKVIRQAAKDKGGECLSSKYSNARTPMRWRCANQHIWNMTWNDLQQGTWCPKCYRINSRRPRKTTLEKISKIVAQKNGRVLSDGYSVGKKMRFQCSNGHVWETMASRITMGRWCRTCAILRVTYRSLLMKAKSKGGTIISPEYLGKDVKLKFKCAYGHYWKDYAYAIRRGHWCPTCVKKDVGRYKTSVGR